MRGRSRHNTKQRKQLKIALIALVLIGLGWMLPKAISVASAVVVYPFHSVNIWIQESSSLVPTFVRGRLSLENEIKELENEVRVSKGSSLTQRRLSEENKDLRSQLGFAGSTTRVTAAVIARPDELPYDLLQIDRGSNQGIEVGAPVFVGSDVVIGLVNHVASEYSFVSLVTSPGFVATAFVSGPDVVVEMEGLGGGVARVKVPQGIVISEGDLVHLPSVEPGVFGHISYVESEPTQPEQYGYVSANTAFSGLHRVTVGKLSQISRSPAEIDVNVRAAIEKSLLMRETHINSSTSTASTSEEQLTEE